MTHIKCWFGHKFVVKVVYKRTIEQTNPLTGGIEKVNTCGYEPRPFCVCCGIPNPHFEKTVTKYTMKPTNQ